MNVDEWHIWRKNGIGSSDAPVIMEASPWKTPYQLWEEKTSDKVSFSSPNKAQQRGLDLEPQAREHFNEFYDGTMEPALFEKPGATFLRASLDGYDKERSEFLEIKCPKREDHEVALSGGVPEKYWPQLQHQFLVTGALKGFYYSYDGEEYVCIEVFPDKDYIGRLLKRELEFWEKVQTRTPPPLSARDYLEINDEKAKMLAKQYIEADGVIKRMQEAQRKRGQDILKLSTRARFKIGKLKVNRHERQGTINYKAIPELKGVDLDSYRKESTVVETIKIETEG